MNIAIILLAGSGQRAHQKEPKQYIASSRGEPLFVAAFNKLFRSSLFDEFYFVIPEGDGDKVQAILASKTHEPFSYHLLEGGNTREESVYNALKEIAKCPANPHSIVLIHDADRPYISNALLERLIQEAKANEAVIPAIPSHDSLLSYEGESLRYLDRRAVYRIQTPQVFHFEKLYKAFSVREKELSSFTDDGSIYLSVYPERIKLIEGEEENIKITTPDELEKWKEEA